ncbi:hypothetical protein D9756_007364 [Leucocoprinus leucothites]|uniref:pyranose dehydrogenase (acceptor) n=1 Tax=Leucocoprinus leucothites TaxID=201217 RepID=A0A8H5D6V0_9AGAR|nr:hypothetical protein D9756_010019 [Leucoagaricus leucothites]KAF5354288.1 hypothetical protein D9756_007364 [Leucoagaricus leucothites]
MIPGLPTVLTLFSFVAFVFGVQYFHHPAGLPTLEFDFIVVGGGNAGGVVASRLGEVEDYKILVIEAGPSDQDVFSVQVPALAADIWFGSSVDWNFTTPPQTNTNDRVLEYPRAKILGGCSSHNDMIYNRGSRDDYNRWASTTGDDNLAWDQIRPFILKTEKWSSPNDPSFSEQGHFNTSIHSSAGVLGVTAPYYNHPLNDLLLKATAELSDEYPFLQDLNDGRPIGLGWGQATITHGFRTSSSTAYLANSGDNVHVLLNTLVTRVTSIDETGSNDFREVILASTPEGSTMKLIAKKEVILSAGVIQTPQLLLLSGIGPVDELKALGIEVFVDNPSVGKNFSDHITIPIKFSTDLPTSSFDETAALAQWKSNHTGRLALSQHLPQIGWVRFPQDSPPFKNGAVDPTAGPDSPHVEVFFVGVSEGSEENSTLSMNIVNLTPACRGSITLATSSPFNQPIIDPALLDSPLDTAILLEGFRSAQRLLASNTLSEHILGLDTPASSSSGTITDDDVI